jgi:hypothetical protein
MELAQRTDIPADRKELYKFAKEVGALENDGNGAEKEPGMFAAFTCFWFLAYCINLILLVSSPKYRDRQKKRIQKDMSWVIINIGFMLALVLWLALLIASGSSAIWLLVGLYLVTGVSFASWFFWVEIPEIIEAPEDLSRVDLVGVLQEHYQEKLEERREKVVGEDSSLSTHINRTESKIAEINSVIGKLKESINQREWSEGWMKSDLKRELEKKKEEKHKLQHTFAFLQMVRKRALERIEQAESQLTPLSSTLDDLEAYQDLMEKSKTVSEDVEEVSMEAIDLAWNKIVPVLAEVEQITNAATRLNTLSAAAEKRQIPNNSSAIDSAEIVAQIEELQRNAEDMKQVTKAVAS